MARKPAPPAIELKSATLDAMRLLLRSADAVAIAAALDSRLGSAPGFFSGEPAIPNWPRMLHPNGAVSAKYSLTTD